MQLGDPNLILVVELNLKSEFDRQFWFWNPMTDSSQWSQFRLNYDLFWLKDWFRDQNSQLNDRKSHLNDQKIWLNDQKSQFIYIKKVDSHLNRSWSNLIYFKFLDIIIVRIWIESLRQVDWTAGIGSKKSIQIQFETKFSSRSI